jgi:O-antigen/teichoic acid export membrane protein
MSAYWLALGFQRSLLTTPLVSSSAALTAEDRALAIRKGLTVQLFGASSAALTLLLLGLLIGGDAGRGLLIITPWLPFALLQDFWRAILFQEQRGKAAAVNDVAWALVMILALPFAWLVMRDWTIIGCWGIGAVVAAFFGFAQTGVRPRRSDTFSWWRTRLWPFGRWLGLESVAYSLATTGTVFILYSILGANAVGGLRAAQSLFAPLSLVLPAIALPGLPAIARTLASSGLVAAIRLSAILSSVAGALAAAYVAFMVLLGGSLIPDVFGSAFSGYADLVWPIGAWQLVLALGAGFALFLTAQQRGRDLFVIRGTGAVVSVTVVSLFAWTSGVVGAAWGYALGGLVATVLTVAFVARFRVRAAHGEKTGAFQDGARGA